MDAFNWLHLSDLHWGQSQQKKLWPQMREAFVQDLARLHRICGPWQAVLFTGDLVQKGQDFERLERDVLTPLWDELGKFGPRPVLLAVPGNHDLQRPKGKSLEGARDHLLAPGGFRRISEKFWNEPKSEYRRVIDKAFTSYRGWWQKQPFSGSQAIHDGILPGDFSTTLQTETGRKIGVLGLNTTFLQLAEGDFQGQLAWDVSQFHGACQGDGVAWAQRHDACLLLTHQGPAWLDPPSHDGQYSEINPAGRFAVHLFGHMHEETSRSVSHDGGPLVRHWQGASLFGLEPYKDKNGHEQQNRRHGYSAGRIQFDGQEPVLRHWPLRATSGPNGWRFVADDKFVLEADGGTKPERLRLHVQDATTSVAADVGPPFAEVLAETLARYHRHVQTQWAARWAPPEAK